MTTLNSPHDDQFDDRIPETRPVEGSEWDVLAMLLAVATALAMLTS
jgi:hypothetical protein